MPSVNTNVGCIHSNTVWNSTPQRIIAQVALLAQLEAYLERITVYRIAFEERVFMAWWKPLKNRTRILSSEKRSGITPGDLTFHEQEVHDLAMGELVNCPIPIGLLCCITALLYYKNHEA